MTLHTHSEPGGKVVNEDYLIARPHPTADSVYICILADGQGGRANAAQAARTACEAAWSYAAKLSPDQLFHEGI